MKNLCERPLPMCLLLNELFYRTKLRTKLLVRLNKPSSIAKFPFQFKDFTALGGVRAAGIGAGRCCRLGTGSHSPGAGRGVAPARPL